MAQMHKSPEHKHSEYSDHAYVSPLQNLRNLNSSGGLRNKADQNKSSSNNIISDQSMTDNLGSDNSRQFSAQGPHRYRITTSTGGLRSPQGRGGENKANAVYGEGKGKGYLDSLGGGQSIRGISGSGEKDVGKVESKYMKIDRERLYEEGLQLKKQLNSLQDENTKLRTRNAHLEKEAVKFEKMFQEASTNPNKKNKQSVKPEGLDVPTLKQHIRDLKSELDDRDSELNGLKKKAKVTKIHELEVQLQALQDETLRLTSYAEAIIAKKTDNIIQEGEKHLVMVQSVEATRLKKELDALQHANKTYELRCQDYQVQLTNKEEKFKRDQAYSNRIVQNKERELVKLRSQLVGFTATSATAGKDDKKKDTDKASAEGHIKKEVEKMTTENRSLKTNLEEKDNEILKLEKQLKEIEAKIETKPTSSKEFLLGKPEHHEHAPHAHVAAPKETKHEVKEEEAKKVISNPSYQAQKAHVEEPKKEQTQPAPVEKKEIKPVKEEKPLQKPVAEPKISADDAKKVAYHINLSFRVKGVPFEAIEKLDWKKQAQSDGSLNRDQIVKILKNDIFGLSEKEVTLLAQYLLQESNPKDGKTTDIDGVKATLTGLLGPLPYWDDEMKKKLHSSISKICTEYRETLTEALSLISNGKYLTRKHLEEAAEAVEVPLNFAQLEYIVTKLYERSGDANKLVISDLFEIFHFEEKESKPAVDNKAAKPKESPKKEQGKKVEEKPVKETKEKKKTVSKEEEAYGIFEDDDDDHKLSDEEDGEKYEYLFPPEGEEKHEKITERGEEEEEDEEYKEDDYEEEENKEEVVKPKVEVKGKQKEEKEEDEYDDDAYEEEEEEEKPKPKAKEEVKKSSVTSVPKSSREEEAKKSKRLTEEEEEEYVERKPSNASKKSGEVAKVKKKTEEDDYEEEYEAEFNEEDDQ